MINPRPNTRRHIQGTGDTSSSAEAMRNGTHAGTHELVAGFRLSPNQWISIAAEN